MHVRVCNICACLCMLCKSRMYVVLCAAMLEHSEAAHAWSCLDDHRLASNEYDNTYACMHSCTRIHTACTHTTKRFTEHHANARTRMHSLFMNTTTHTCINSSAPHVWALVKYTPRMGIRTMHAKCMHIISAGIRACPIRATHV
jgi:hypothetical protein